MCFCRQGKWREGSFFMGKMSGSLADDMDYLNGQLGVGTNFDVLYRVVTIGGRNACVYMIDGFCKDEVMQKLLQHFIGITEDKMPSDAHEQAACAVGGSGSGG